MRVLVQTLLLAAALAGVRCASAASVHWTHSPDDPDAPASMRQVSVMEPLVDGTAVPGNAGRDIPAVKYAVHMRILGIVSEHSTVVDMTVRPHRRNPALTGYRAALGGAR